jgi:hypothetical protein
MGQSINHAGFCLTDVMSYDTGKRNDPFVSFLKDRCRVYLSLLSMYFPELYNFGTAAKKILIQHL